MKRVSKEDIKQDILRVAEKLETDTLSSTDYDEHGNSSSTTARNRFGSWGEAVKAVELDSPTTKRKIPTKEELWKDILRVDNKISGRPKRSNYKQIGEYSEHYIDKHFDSWNNVVEKLGYERYDPSNPATPADIVQDIKLVYKELGEVPTSNQYTKHGQYSINKITDKMGSWNKALRFANLPVNKTHVEYKSDQEITREDLIEQVEVIQNAVEESLYHPVAHYEAERLQLMIEDFTDDDK